MIVNESGQNQSLPGQEKGQVVYALDVLNNQTDTGQKVAVIGGGMVGTETVLYLAEEKQREVVLVEMADQIMGDIGHSEGETGGKVVEVTNKGIILQNKKGRVRTLEADTVVIAAGFTPDNELARSLSTNDNLEIFSIGDCVKPAKFLDATHQAFHIARKI